MGAEGRALRLGEVVQEQGEVPGDPEQGRGPPAGGGAAAERSFAIYPNRREEGSVSRQLRIVAEAGHVVGTRGQQRVRIIIVRDTAGFRVENAFPVHQH